MTKHTIISKRTSPFIYTKWRKVNGQFIQEGKGIVINGGAGIVGGAELLSGRPLEHRGSIIPASVITFVDDEALKTLMSIGKFRKDLQRGIVQVVKGKIDQDKADSIASKDMLEDDHIPTRPITGEEVEHAGGELNKDGSVGISSVRDGMSPLKARTQDAGQPHYVQKRNRAARKRKE